VILEKNQKIGLGRRDGPGLDYRLQSPGSFVHKKRITKYSVRGNPSRVRFRGEPGENTDQFRSVLRHPYLSDENRCLEKGICFPGNSCPAAFGAQQRDTMEVIGW
jgi:hypothetical protein